MSNGNTSRPVFPLLVSGGIVAALTGLYAVYHLRTHDIDDLRRATEGLLQGTTHWITFQNRVLGPLLIALMRAVTGWSWMRSFYVLTSASLFAGGFLLVWRAWKKDGQGEKGLGACAGWFLLAFLFNHAWSYPWDFLGALLNLLLVLWAMSSFRAPGDLWSWRPLLLLAALMLNRESSVLTLGALFCTVALVLRETPRRERATAWGSLAAIAVLAVANVALVLCLRRLLFEQSSRPLHVHALNETAAGNFLQLAYNWRLLTSGSETLPVRGIAWANLLLVGIYVANSVAKLWQLVRGRMRFFPGQIFPHLYLCAAFAAIVVFADMSEARVYFEIIPLCVLLTPALFQQSPSPAAVEATA